MGAEILVRWVEIVLEKLTLMDPYVDLYKVHSKLTQKP
jgi:hypothetical protein